MDHADTNAKKVFFDHHAHHWDECNYSAAELARIGPLVESLGIEPGARVLDVGCGTGILTPYLLAAVGASGSIVGLDLSPVMIDKARGKGFPENVRFLEAVGENIPLPDAACDAAVCLSVFPHLTDQRAALREIWRVLQPGGWCWIAHLDGSAKINAFHAGYGGPVKHDHLPGREAMLTLLAETGFPAATVIDREDLYLACGRKG